jgi:hypothetical protein
MAPWAAILDGEQVQATGATLVSDGMATALAVHGVGRGQLPAGLAYMQKLVFRPTPSASRRSVGFGATEWVGGHRTGLHRLGRRDETPVTGAYRLALDRLSGTVLGTG